MVTLLETQKKIAKLDRPFAPRLETINKTLGNLGLNPDIKVGETYGEVKQAFRNEVKRVEPDQNFLKKLVTVFRDYVIENFFVKYFPQWVPNSRKPVQTLIDGAFEKVNLSHRIKEFNPKFTQIQNYLRPSREGKKERPDYYDWMDFSENGIIETSLKETKDLAAQIMKEKFTHALVMGMGGSSMCGNLISSAFPNPSLKGPAAKGLRVETLDTMDPAVVESKLGSLPNLPPDDAHYKTAYVVISKSGGTFEVAHQVQAIINHLKNKVFNGNLDAALKRFAQNVVFICQDDDKESNTINKLRKELEKKTGIRPKFINHPEKIGGRYSLFSPVGMFVSELKGLKTDDFIAGAKQCLDEFFAAKNIQKCDAAKYAVLDMLLAQDPNFVARYIMTYGDRLSAIPEFTAQLAGEGLNKDHVDALNQMYGRGSTAHHSDVEALCKAKGKGKVLFEDISIQQRDDDQVHGDTGLDSLRDYQHKSMHQELTTKLALPFNRHISERKANPVISTILKKVDEKTIGYLMMRYMLSTVIEAGLQEKGNLVENLDKAVKQSEVEFFKKQKANDATELKLSKVELAKQAA